MSQYSARIIMWLTCTKYSVLFLQGRELALKELGLEQQSMSNWSSTLKNCSYIRPIEDTELSI